MNTLDILVECGGWDEKLIVPLAQRAVVATLHHMQLEPDDCEVTVMACDDARIAVLNAEFRGKPVATNVLSWPAQRLAPPAEGGVPPLPEKGFDGMLELGDIALSFETCTREAMEASKPVADHLTHLIVHGTLHLLGYDHITDGDAALMERIEVEILGNLGLDDPYTADITITGAPN
ncbi:rRNA maturation RNase YbeY [Sulfitobacter guttiformis]|uniref:Endoribonuclease YbeY n=1 Tax=Sulfitobacter guttiformis TaxID=74349 RepID=A0A420DQ32_9RHOB|nr:rRNA maturation RNase YbeY [Sulfitobacter guttiformis]KIN73589.1 putative rRNA maturation factor [Sulfitobacter guttiformis KCTC 32187]RKE96237.1 putative rRNA maturation factor [Sulfitobacter guttiformis]